MQALDKFREELFEALADHTKPDLFSLSHLKESKGIALATVCGKKAAELGMTLEEVTRWGKKNWGSWRNIGSGFAWTEKKVLTPLLSAYGKEVSASFKVDARKLQESLQNAQESEHLQGETSVQLIVWSIALHYFSLLSPNEKEALSSLGGNPREVLANILRPHPTVKAWIKEFKASQR